MKRKSIAIAKSPLQACIGMRRWDFLVVRMKISKQKYKKSELSILSHCMLKLKGNKLLQ